MTNITFDGPIEPGAESLVKTARLFYVGRHKGRDYSKADLAAIVSNFTADSRVPVQIDHSMSARDTVGIVRKVWLSNDGSEILGEIEILGRENVDRVRLGLWKQVSVGLNISEPDMIMYEVSVTPFPALKEAQIFKIEEKSKGEPEKMSDKKATVEVETVNMAEFVSMKAELVQLKAEKAELEKAQRMSKDKEAIEAFVLSGKTTPAMKETELALYHSLTDEQRKTFTAYKSAMPAFVDVRTHSTVSADKPATATAEMTADEALAEAKRIMGVK